MNNQMSRKLEGNIRQIKRMISIVICLLLVIIWILLPRPLEALYIVALCISVPVTFVGVTYFLERIWPTRKQRSDEGD